MNWLDITVIALLAIAAIGGLFQGLIKSVFSLAGLILGVVLAGHYYRAVAGLLGFIPNENIARIAAFIIIFLIVLIVAFILGTLFTRLVSAMLLGWVNRLGGAVLGAVLGAILISAILAIWAKYAGTSAISDSALASFLLNSFPVILALLPAEFDSVRRFF